MLKGLVRRIVKGVKDSYKGAYGAENWQCFCHKLI